MGGHSPCRLFSQQSTKRNASNTNPLKHKPNKSTKKPTRIFWIFNIVSGVQIGLARLPPKIHLEV